MLLIVVEDIVGDRINEPGSRFSLRLWRSPSADKTKEAAGTVENKAHRSRYSVAPTLAPAKGSRFSLRLGRNFDIFRQDVSAETKPPGKQEEKSPHNAKEKEGTSEAGNEEEEATSDTEGEKDLVAERSTDRSSVRLDPKSGMEIERKANWRVTRVRGRKEQSHFADRLLAACRMKMDGIIAKEASDNSGVEKFQYNFVSAFPKNPQSLYLDGKRIFHAWAPQGEQDLLGRRATESLSDILRKMCAELDRKDFIVVTALICADPGKVMHSVAKGRDDPLMFRTVEQTRGTQDRPSIDISRTDEGFRVEWSLVTYLGNLKYTGDLGVAIDTGDDRYARRSLTFVFERHQTDDGMKGALRLARIENLSTNIILVDATTGRPI